MKARHKCVGENAAAKVPAGGAVEEKGSPAGDRWQRPQKCEASAAGAAPSPQGSGSTPNGPFSINQAGRGLFRAPRLITQGPAG